ncbi:hypothetical protein [Sphaerisporangium sp. TRM90804]|uniref:hypothetical protein n=1 Tax=Sphaerisporangium sp. TRM90804 TaxID=3031113 RepID=UPI00244AA3AF|nr:hypothetical protein [Sphaerisporangium sp. TRM90804]MDH2427401.1 hypothetical protein [Sphaerisporangium sp. TRM90804]
MRNIVILTVCAALAAACATAPSSANPVTPSPPGTPPATGPTASAAPAAGTSPTAAGGCGETPVREGRPPDWATVNAPGTRFVVGREGDVLGYLFTRKLRAGKPTNPYNKILWYVRLPRGTDDLRYEGRPRGRSEPVVQGSFPPNSGPGEIYPSSIDVPAPGCWTFELTWGRNHDTIDLLYQR